MGFGDNIFPGSAPRPGGRALQPRAQDGTEDTPSTQPTATTPAPSKVPALPPVADDDADPDDSTVGSFPVATTRAPSPQPNRFNYTVFASDPVLAQTFAPEIAGEQQAQAQDAVNAERARKQAETDARADQRATTRTHNADLQRQAEVSGFRTVRDADGLLQPLQDDQGRTLYHPHVSDVQYDPTTGEPFQESRDEFGQTTRANPDANAPVGPNTGDPSDPQLYRQNKFQKWQPVGHVDDLAGDKDQPAEVRAVAADWQQKRGKLIRDKAIETAHGEAANAEAAHEGAKSQVERLTAQNTDLQKQIEAIDSDPNRNKWQDETLGFIGGRPTDAATNLAARRADLVKQQEQVASQLAGVNEQVPLLEKRAKEARVDAEITSHGITASNYGDMADQRRAFLKTMGRPEKGDPVLAAILQKTDEFGVKLSVARAAREASNPSPATPSAANTSGNRPPVSPAKPPARSGQAPASPPPPPAPLAAAGTPPADPVDFVAPAAPPPSADAGSSAVSPDKQSPALVSGQASAEGLSPTSGALPNAGREFVAGAAAGTLRVAEGVNRLSAGQDFATPESVVANLDREIAARKEGIANIDALPEAARGQMDTARATLVRELASLEKKRQNPKLLRPGDAPGFGTRDLLTPEGQARRDKRVASANETADTFRDAAEASPEFYGTDPARKDERTAKFARGVGGALPMVAASAVPGVGAVAGASVAAVQTKATSYDEYLDEAKKKGMVDADGKPTAQAIEEARQYSDVAAIKTLPQMLAYIATGHLAAGVVSKLLSASTPAATRLLVTTAASTAANATAGTANKAVEQLTNGKPLDLHYDAESLGQDLLFGLHHGAGTTLQANAVRVEAEHQYARNNVAINAARERTSPVTAVTAADHLAIPPTTDLTNGASTADPAKADASVAASFEARNPDAPKIDPAVVAKAREFAPPGSETSQPVVLAALDQRINDLESKAADTAQSRGSLKGVDLEARAQTQQDLAQAYQQKAALIAHNDARLLAVQQISALPDWEPPLDPETRQPSESPDPNRTRETAGALLKVANGFGADDLTTAEQARLKTGGDQSALTRKAPDGSTILTDAGRQQLAQVAPAAAPFIQGTEAADLRVRQKSAAADPSAPAPTSRAGEPPAPADGSETGSEATPAADSTGRRTSDAEASSPQADNSTTGSFAPLADRMFDRLRQHVADAGRTLTPAQETRARQLTRTAADNLTKSLQKYQRAFRSIGADIVENESVESGGIHSPAPGEIRLVLDDIIHPGNLDSFQNPARAERAVQEEAIHSVAQHLEARGEINPSGVWQSLPPVLQRRIEAAYPDMPDDRVKGHEALRMLVQGRLNMSKEGWKLDGNLLTEQADPGIFAQSRQALFKLLKFFRDLHGSIVRAGGKPEDAKLVAETADRLHNVVRGIVDSPTERSDVAGNAGAESRAGAASAQEPSGRTTSRPGERPAGESGDLRPAEGVSRATAGDNPAREQAQGEDASGLGSDDEAAARPRFPSDEERVRAAAGLGVQPDQIGHVAEVTSSTGQRVRTAYVAREATDARPSHNPEGVPTLGYPQDFQPRDRSGAAYRRQAQNIAGDLDLDRLADSPRPDEGSPIVTASGHTLTGNGRDIAIGLAHREGNPSATKYRARLFQRAPEFGIDRSVVSRMKQPVLHRVILGHESPDALRRFSEDSNASPAMQSNALEVAGQDAKRLTPALLSLFDPNYNLESGKNADFLKAFGQQVILGRTRPGEGTANELNISPADLARRARLSLFAAAYGGDNAGRAALERMGGDSEDNGRNISQALLTLAPVMARLRADTETGNVHPGYDLSQPLVRAAQEISEAVANRPPKQSAGAAIDGLLAQQTFDADPMERAALGFFARHRASRTALEEGLSNYAEGVYGLGNPKHGADMFGRSDMPSPFEMFQRATGSEMAGQRATLRTRAAQSLRATLRARPAEIDPRITEAFGEDWQPGYDEMGLPNFPRTLRPEEEHWARSTMEPDRPETLPPTATIVPDSPFAKLYPGMAGKTIPRATLHKLILSHFMKEGPNRPAGALKEAWLSGGGGGAGKSTILRVLEERGAYTKAGKVSINADDIKELLPEYHRLIQAGDSRATNASHEESSYLAKQLQARAIEAGHSLVFDATLAKKQKALDLIQRLKNEGYRVHLAAITVEPYEALIRAMTRAKGSGRYVPIHELLAAHKGFNDALPSYIDAVDQAVAFDNTPPAPTQIALDDLRSGAYSIVRERAQLSTTARTRDELIRSYRGEGNAPAQLPADHGRGDDQSPRGGPGGGGSQADASEGVHPVRQPGSVNDGTLRARRAVRDPNQDDFFGSLDATDAAKEYAASLPAAAKVNRPTLERETAKDLPELQGNDAAMGELFAHAHRSLTGSEPESTAKEEDANRNADTSSAGSGVRSPELRGGRGTSQPPAQSDDVRPGGAKPVRGSQPDLFGSGQPGSERSGNGGRGASEPGDVPLDAARPDPAGESPRGGADDQRPGSEPGVSGNRPKPAVVAPPRELAPEERNHRIGPDEDEIAPRGNTAKLRANLDAISLLKRLESEDRNATPEEKKLLARYTGWGWAGEYFNPANHRYAAEHAQLRGAMADQEFRAAAASTTNAHYTSPKVIRSMWKMAERLGFKGGRVLEPAGGVGHFFGLMPDSLEARSQLEGVELDSLSARIMRKLYPQAKVFQGGFEESKIPNNSLDLAISNVPFGNYKLKADDYPNLLIHDYFFARSLDKVKPGGLVLFVTSDGTMDKADSTARKLIAEKADLVGAVRLPNDAFAANAGTQVTTDILAFRKKTAAPFEHAQPFLNRAEVGTTPEGAPLRANEYYAAHPEMALGEHSTAGTMYSRDDYALTARPGQDTARLLEDAVGRLPENVVGDGELPGLKSENPARQDEAAAEGQREGSTQYDSAGNFAQVDNGQLKEAPWLTRRNFGDKNFDDAITPEHAARRKIIAGDWLKVRDAARTLLDAENDPASTDTDLRPLRADLNRAYDRYTAANGQLNRREGQQHLEKARFLEDDPDYPLVQALEDEKRDAQGRRPVDPATGKEIFAFQKGKIFSQRIRSPKEPPTRANDVADAVSISLGHHGSIDPAVVGRLLNVSPEEARRQIVASGRAFEDPGTGLFQTRERYLSGNVREKLRAAERAAAENPALQPNVEALRKVQPETVPSHQIFVQLGSRWLPNEVYQQFVRDVLKSDAVIRYQPEINKYAVKGGRTSPEVLTTYGTSDLSGFDLLQHGLDGTEPTITRTRTIPGGGKETYTDQPATSAARERLTKLKREFESWARTTASTPEVSGHGSASVGEHIERTYNTQNNAMVAPQYDGSYLTLPGMTDTVRRLPHRLSVVARILQEGSAMMAHGVGSGKTFSQIVAAMEMRRLGLSKKPLIVVQKATLGQFASSFRRAYPDARLLVANEKDFSEARRARFMARIATGDHDAIVITQPQFDRIQSHPDTVRRYFTEKIDQLEEAIRTSREENGQRDPTTKQLETAKRNLETKMFRRLQGLKSNQDTKGLHFEEMGVDSLFLDEAHAYKKVPIITQKKNVKGIPNDDSQRAIGLEMKVRHIQDQNNGRNVILATGTPITNSIAEAYVMLKLATPHVLEEYGIRNFDDFANTFGQTQSKLEYSWSGKWKNVTRFNKFANGPELVTMIRSGFDVKMGNKELGLKVPEMKGGGPQVQVVPQTRSMEHVTNLIDRVADAYDAAEDKREISYVPIVTMQAGMAGALDPRLIDPALPDDAGSKVNTALRNVVRIHAETTADRSTQMIFADRFKPMDTSKLRALLGGDKSGVQVDTDPEEGSAPPPDAAPDAEETARALAEEKDYKAGGFNLYRDMKAKLIAAGIPENEIAIIHDYGSDKARERLFDDVNSGNVRVLIGSTEKMGVGVNAQKRLYAVHHLDPPRMMTPAMMEQRNGRIIRQGNDNPMVENLQYGVERSMDTAIYQMLEDKQRFISQALGGILKGRTFDDAADEVALSMSQMKALTSGDPRVIRRAEVEARLNELAASRAGFEGERGQLSRRLANARLSQQRIAERDIPAARRLNEVLPNVLPTDADARKALASRLDGIFARLGQRVVQNNENGPTERTDINGLPVRLTALPGFGDGGKQVHYGYEVYHPDAPNSADTLRTSSVQDGAGVLQSLGTFIRGHASEPERLARQHAELTPQIAEMERASAQPWEHEQEYGNLQAEHADLNQALVKDSGKTQKPLLSQRARLPVKSVEEAGADNDGQRKLAAKLWSEKHTDSPFFKRWFGNSKVVDTDGKPLVMYHGTPTGTFDTFDVYGSRYGLFGQGSYFTDSQDIATQYAYKGKPRPNEKNAIYPVYLSIQHPIDMDAKADIARWQATSFAERYDLHLQDGMTNEQVFREAEEALRNEGNIPMYEGAEEMQDALRSMGYDGATHIGGGRVKSNDGTKHRVYIAFEPEQIKSAIGNSGEFDPNESSILRTQRFQAADTSETSSSHPIDDLLSLLDEEHGEKIDAAQDKAAAETPGQRTVGRPDLAFANASNAHRAVDQVRADEHVAQTQAQWNAEAERRFTANPEGEVRNLASKALTGDQLDAVETKIAQRAVAAELAKPDSPAQRRKVQAMIYGYRLTGTEQARAMAARHDPHQTPAERHKEFLGRVIYTPPAEVRAKLEALPKGDVASRQALLDADQQRVNRIEAELKKMGVTFDDVFRGEVQLRLRGAQIIDNTSRELFDGAGQRALNLLQGGGRSFADVATATGLKESEVKQKYLQMREALKAKLRDKVRRGATAENLDMQTLRAQPAAGAEPAFRSEAETEAELERILAQMGYGDPARVGKMKVRQPKKAIFRPPVVAADPAQMEAWKKGGVGDDVRAKVPVGQSSMDFGQRPPTGTGERAGARFVRPSGDEQSRIDFAGQEPATGGGTGERAGARFVRPSGDEQSRIDFAGQEPATGGGTGERAGARFVRPSGDEQSRIDFAGQEPATGGGTGERAAGKFLQGNQGRLDVDDGPPVSSSIDMSDPVVATRIFRAIQSVDSNLYDKMFEFWSAGLLSGPQTHVAIGVGNTLNAGFELTVQRGMEALLNTAYRDPNSAQFGELKYILRGILPGIRAGLSLGLKSFQAEASMFEPTYLDQQLTLDPGEHMNAGHKVAIQGKLGKIVRLPFRAVGFMDGFMKASIFHMEVAGQAYRMAKAEGLKGALLGKRMAELSAPGGEAAIRAVSRAEEMIGQAPYLSETDPQREADAHAQRVDAAYRQARAEGKIGDAITERATELLRKPDAGGWRRFVPPGIEHNPMDMAMSKFHEMARSTKLLSYVFPYLRMPYNLMKMGLRKSPLGVTNVAARLINAGLYKIKDGKPIFESYPAALQTRHLAEQAFAWTAACLLYSAVEGDGEDDRKKRFLITGTRAFRTDKQGERDLLERTSGGALTLRIGDTTINYGRYEPIASVLGTLADGVRSLKAMHNGATKRDAIDKFMGYVSDQVMAKTMLQGMSDLAKDVEGGAGTADRAKRAMMTALVPNIIRQPLRNLDDYVRDTHGAPSPYSFFPMGGFGEHKQTPYGQPVKKTSNPLARVLFPGAVQPTERLNNADRLLMNWNASHPGEAWAPEPLSRKKLDPKTGKETEMTNEEYAVFQRRAALKVNAKLAGIVNASNAAHPTADDLHKVRQAFQQAHHEAKIEAFGDKKDPLPTVPLPKPAPKPRDISTMMGWN